jgi:hypothetical protein
MAATTGKITGTVRDASTGEALPGANIVIQGMRRGASTDAEGQYLILAVEPGNYVLQASIVGYTTETRSEVRVIADYTTTVDFVLKEGSVVMAEMVVVADRPPVEPDKTTSKYVVTAEDVQAVPMVRSSTELVSLQPGMALDGGDRIRGSEEGAVGRVVGYYVDGIEVTRDGFSNVNTSAIQEVSVLTGGMNAEFGNALAGVVTLVTKDGSSSFSGMGEYRFTPKGKRHWAENLYDNPVHKNRMKWNDPDWVNERDPVTGELIHVRSDYTEHTGHRAEGNLSGPLTNGSSFFVSTTYNKSPSRLPSAAPTSPFNTRNVGNLTFRPQQSVKVKVGGLLDRSDEFYTRDPDWQGSIKTMGQDDLNGRNIFLPENWAASGKRKITDSMVYLNFTHSLGVKSYYDARIYMVGSRVDPYDVPDATEPIRADASGWFYLPRKILAYEESSDKRLGLKLDYTSQVTRSHLLQAGIEAVRHDYWYTSYFDGAAAGTRVLTVVGEDYNLGQGVHPFELRTYVQDKLEYGGLIVNAGLRWDYFNYGRPWRQAPGIEISPMYTKFTYRQYELDHMESGSPTFQSFSPRVGISHPITAGLAAHYFIGRFHTIPPMYELFGQSYGSQSPDRDVNGNKTIDPTEKWNALDAVSSFNLGGGRHATEGLHPERTTNVEMGVDWNFVADYTTSLTAFYRLDEGLYGTNNIIYWICPKVTTSQIGVLRNAYWSSSRGLEVSLRKAFSDNFSFRVGYNLEWQHGIGYGGSSPHYGLYEGNWYLIPDSSYVASEHYWYKYAAQPDGSEVPVALTPAEVVSLGAAANRILEEWQRKKGTPAATGIYSEAKKINEKGLWVVGSSYGANPAPRNFGRSSQLSVQFAYATRPDYGPLWGRFRPFGGLKVSSVYRMISGTPFQYTPPEGPAEWRKQSPAMRTDVHVQKGFRSAGALKPSLFVEITNLFNEKNSSADNFQFVQYGLKEPAPDSPDYLTYGDTGAWSRYRWDPRLIEAGLLLEF